MPEEALETDVTEEEVEVEPFMVEDEDEADNVCLTCTNHKVGSKVCGILKPFRDYMRLNGHTDTEETFTCNEYKGAE